MLLRRWLTPHPWSTFAEFGRTSQLGNEACGGDLLPQLVHMISSAGTDILLGFLSLTAVA